MGIKIGNGNNIKNSNIGSNNKINDKKDGVVKKIITILLEIFIAVISGVLVYWITNKP